MATGPFWDPPTQHAFRALIWEHMSYMWHAKIVFWIADKTVVAVNGRPYFSKFTSPAQNGATDLDLWVYDQSVLSATVEEKLLSRVPALALGLFGVVALVLFALFDPLDPKAKYLWVLKQIVVELVKYYDWEVWGINTTLKGC